MSGEYPIEIESANQGTLLLNDDWGDGGGWWQWNDLAGWYGTNLRQTLLDRDGVPGQMIGEQVRLAKTLAVTCFAGVVDGDRYWAVADWLDAFVDDLVDSDATLTFHKPNPEALTVRLAPGPLGVLRKGTLRTTDLPADSIVTAGFDFLLSLVAADPAKTPVAS